jgi:tetratricopeptide (TPR) repeat protein
LANFGRALQLDPQMASACLARAILLRREGDHSRALAELGSVLKLEPDNLRAWEELGES